MDRLKELGTWVILIIAFWIFSNGVIYLTLNQINPKTNNVSNTQVVNQSK